MEKTSGDPDFWTDSVKAQRVQKEIKNLKTWVEAWESLKSQADDLEVLGEMAEEENDAAAKREVQSSVEALEASVSDLELKRMLGGEDDARHAILSVHPGAGGTESQDWAYMLMRMYVNWMNKKGMKFEILDEQPGEEAGIKSVTIEVEEEFAFGYLRSEIGVHRLVRISPYDANARRHTSFAAVYVYPVVEDVDFELDEKDIKVDTFRAGGAGGQHINKTDSAVRMTHIPTGIIAACQSERSQHKNRANALKMLKAKLYQKHRDDEEAKREAKAASKLKIEWGSQIRSYVLHPYNLVKDVRTDHETSDAHGVLDGNLDPFINAYLLAASEANQ